MLGWFRVRRGLVGLSLALGALLPIGTLLAASADTFRWYYKPNYGVDAEPLPLALYSLPDTLASYVFECHWQSNTLDLVAFEGEIFEGKRRFVVRVGDARFVGQEQLDPPDALVTSRMSIPLDHPVVERLGDKPQRIAITAVGWPRALPGSPIVSRVIRECRTLARAGERIVTPGEPASDS